MDWLTWSPHQSEKTQEICKHLTRNERWAAAGQGALFGLIIAGTWMGLFLLFVCGWRFGVSLPLCFILGIAIVITGGIAAMRLRAKQQEWLLSTRWARTYYSPDGSVHVSDES